MDIRSQALQLALRYNDCSSASIEEVIQDAEKILVFLEGDEIND